MNRLALGLTHWGAGWAGWHVLQARLLRAVGWQRRQWLAAMLGLTVLAASVASNAQAAEITDDRGRTLRFDKPALRVVSLLPSLTESVCALGACQRLVGVDRYSDWPAQVKRLPQVGGGLDRSEEHTSELQSR